MAETPFLLDDVQAGVEGMVKYLWQMMRFRILTWLYHLEIRWYSKRYPEYITTLARDARGGNHITSMTSKDWPVTEEYGIYIADWPELGETHLVMTPKWMWDEYFNKRRGND